MSEDLTPSQREAAALYEQAREAITANRPAEALDLLRKCLAQARELTNSSLCGTVLFEMGFILTSLDKPDEAVDAYEECLLFYERRDTRRELQTALFQIAQVYRLVGRERDAADAYTRLVEVSHALGDGRAEGIALSMLGRMTAETKGPAAGMPEMLRGVELVYSAAPQEAELMIEHVRFFGRAHLSPVEFAAAVEKHVTDAALRGVLTAQGEGS